MAAFVTVLICSNLIGPAKIVQFDWLPFAKSLPEGPGKEPKLKEFEETNKAIAEQTVAHFAQKVPSFYFFFGATPPAQNLLTTPANHSPLFYVDETALMVGLRSMLYVAVDYLQAPAAKTAPQNP